ncbi:hypothetical protein GP486_003189 [Trichoglossum hirsutum]|uniref:Uncharacterized protein n=1 Tax=Trichoglossum hirsutum TaxID=265104 RepID=A0A9P8LDK3_9PEZI|nr:hypothetical protein GP486_003189 [Trichoglossum hirsutum]
MVAQQPSPPEKKGFWHRSHGSSTPSSHRQSLNDNEPFSISRESFDSYRRSFDISARSPVVRYDVTPPRKSLDSRAMRLPRSATSERRVEREPPTPEEPFEEVGLNDEPKLKKKGLFFHFGDALNTSNPTSNSTHSGFHFSSRKRGHSGQGAELGKIEKPSGSPEIKVGE